MPFSADGEPPDRLERSTLVVPASNYAMIQKAAGSDADAVCIDLEDAVAPEEKAASRANVIRAFGELNFGPRLRSFRINGLDTPFAYRDLIEVVEGVGDRIDLVVVPKVERPADVSFVETLLTQIEAYRGFEGRIGIEVQIESALGCVNVDGIAAASPRLETLVFGSGDYAASARMPLDSIGEADENDRLYPGHHWGYVMSRIVNAARAYRKRCVDRPFAGFRDIEGLRRACGVARVLGFDGKWCIHPSQLAPVNEAFSPPEDQVAWARQVLDEYENALAEGRGASAVGRRMVDAASLRLARNVVAVADRAGSR